MDTLKIKTSDGSFGIYKKASALLSSESKSVRDKFELDAKPLRSNREGMLALVGTLFSIELELSQEWLDRISLIEDAFEREQNATGVTTHLGFNMKSRFEDASILKESVEFLSSVGVTKMTLKDVNGLLHKDIPMADVSQIVSTIALNYMQLWNKRELLKEQIRNASNRNALLQINW